MSSSTEAEPLPVYVGRCKIPTRRTVIYVKASSIFRALMIRQRSASPSSPGPSCPSIFSSYNVRTTSIQTRPPVLRGLDYGDSRQEYYGQLPDGPWCKSLHLSLGISSFVAEADLDRLTRVEHSNWSTIIKTPFLGI
jgi:hypothetical protein